jgi:hypothetical protein
MAEAPTKDYVTSRHDVTFTQQQLETAVGPHLLFLFARHSPLQSYLPLNVH